MQLFNIRRMMVQQRDTTPTLPPRTPNLVPAKAVVNPTAVRVAHNDWF